MISATTDRGQQQDTDVLVLKIPQINYCVRVLPVYLKAKSEMHAMIGWDISISFLCAVQSATQELNKINK